MLINTTLPLVNLKGEQLKDSEEPVTVGSVLANYLSQNKGKFTALKAWALAQRFYTEETIELDDADARLLIETVESIDTIVPMAVGQILNHLN